MPLPFLPPRWDWLSRGWAASGVFVVLSLVVAVAAPWPKHCDFNAYHTAAVRVDHGENPYRLDEMGIHGTYRYPPAVAYLMVPLGRLEVGWAGRLWFAGLWLTLGGCAWLALSLVNGPRPWPAGTSAVAFVALAACSCYNMHNLFQGQVALTMTLCCLGWVACRRAGRPFAGGLLLAVACVLKLAPVVLIPYLLLRKDWRGLLGVSVGGLLLFLTPAPWVGLDATVRMHEEWFRHAKATQVPEQNYRAGNQGVMGIVARLPVVGNGAECFSPDNLAALVKAYPFVIAGLGAVLYGWVLRDLIRRRGVPVPPPHSSGGSRENLHLTLLFIFMTVAHPCAWRCNFAPLLLPCVVLARHALLRRRGAGLCWLGLWLVGLAWAWPAVTLATTFACHPAAFATATPMSMAKGEVSAPGWWLPVWLAQGTHFWVALYVGGLCCWLFSRQGTDGPRPPAGGDRDAQPVAAVAGTSTS